MVSCCHMGCSDTCTGACSPREAGWVVPVQVWVPGAFATHVLLDPAETHPCCSGSAITLTHSYCLGSDCKLCSLCVFGFPVSVRRLCAIKSFRAFERPACWQMASLFAQQLFCLWG